VTALAAERTGVAFLACCKNEFHCVHCAGHAARAVGWPPSCHCSRQRTMSKIKFKCSFQGRTRVARLLTDAGFAALKKRLDGDFGFAVALEYEDEDGDAIVLQTENDFLDMLEDLQGAKTIKLLVSEAAEQPSANPRPSLFG